MDHKLHGSNAQPLRILAGTSSWRPRTGPTAPPAWPTPARAVLLFWGVFMTLGASRDLSPLPRLNISADEISISGLSSGADFAAQFSVAYSRTIMGVGVFAGEPWYCSATAFPNESLVKSGPGSCGLDTYADRWDNCPLDMTVQCDHCKSRPELVDIKFWGFP